MRPYDSKDYYLASFRKDIRYSFLPVFRAMIIIGILCLLIASVIGYSYLYLDNAPVRRDDPDKERSSYDFYEEGEAVEEEGAPIVIEDDLETWERLFEDGATIYALGIAQYLLLITFALLLLMHAMIYTRETRTGSIRSLFRYPISVRDLVQSKVVNSIVMAVLLSVLPTFLTIGILAYLDLYAWEGFILFAVTFLVVILIYLFSTAVSSITTAVWKKGFLLNPGLWLVLGGTMMICMTETVIAGSYRILCEIFRWEYSRPITADLMYLSPFHFLGRFYDMMLIGSQIEWLDLIWIVPFFLVIAMGTLALKRIYPDIFIRETA